MAGRVTVLTPRATSDALELGRTTWRKQVLPIGQLDYKGRKLHFTAEYLQNLVRSFKDRAFDAVPFQLADGDNRHTNDPERTAGEVIGLEAGDDGLYATVSLTDRGSALVREHPNLGVSARIVEQFERGTDGARFPAALQHVLATWDPRINAMRPWQAVECAHETDEVLDLSALLFTDDGTAVVDQTPTATPGGQESPKEGAIMPTLTEEELATVRSILPLIQKIAAPDEGGDDTTATGQATETAGDAESEFTEDELDDMAAGDDLDEVDEIAASNDDQSALELAVADLQAQRDRDAIELANIKAERDAEKWRNESESLIRDYGLPPSIVALAEPLLKGSKHVIELAQGGKVDAGDVLRKVLHTVGKVYGRHVDLSGPVGSAREISAAQAQADEDDAFLAAAHARYGRKES